jgi:hypothetical protein
MLIVYTFHWHWYGTTYGNDRLRDGIRLTISSKSENMKGYCQSMHNTRRRRTLDGLISSIAFLISC